MLARNDSGGRDRFFLRAIIGDLSFRCYSSAELLSSIIYTNLDGFLSEISEVSYTIHASMRAYTRKKDCTIHFWCDIITMG